MSKFEEIGVNRLYEASSAREARNLFYRSCKLCATQGKAISCSNCAIANVHQLVIEIFTR